MIINTDNISLWAKKHLQIVIPIITGLLSWFFALQTNSSHDFLAVFYGVASLASGIMTVVLIIYHFHRLGLFDD